MRSPASSKFGAIGHRYRGLSLHHAVIAGQQQRLGLHELLLTSQTRAEQAFDTSYRFQVSGAARS